MSVLILPVKREYFEQIKAGTKPEEYRIENAYWRKRLEWNAGFACERMPRCFDSVVITLGYPPKHDTTRRLQFPWLGFQLKTITHPHFGADPVSVFAIKLYEVNP